MKQGHDAKGRFTTVPKKPKPPTASLRVQKEIKEAIPKVIQDKTKKAETIKVKARHGLHTVPTTHIDDNTRWVYRNGQCYSLAVVLAEEMGTDVALLVRDNEIPWGTHYDDPEFILDLDHDWFKDAVHAIALLEDDTDDTALAIDIDGVNKVSSLRMEFQGWVNSGTLIRIKPKQLRFLMTKCRKGTGFYEPDYDSAKIVAPLIKRD